MKFIKYISFAVIGLMLYSCGDEFLNPLPDSAIVVDAFFETDDDVLAGIIGVYDAIQGVNVNTESNTTNFNRGIQFEFMVTEMRSDNTRTATLEGSRADFHRYRVDANNVQSEDFYQSMYEIIFRANNILNFVEVADPGNQAAYAAEARFLRAFAYFKLVRLYGPVPLVTRVVGPTEDELLFTRVDEGQIYAQIISDLQDAINNLDNSSKSRASSAAAQGILAKVYLSQPSPNYTGARELCEAIINSGAFSLENDFYDVFYNELNNEILFAIQYEFENVQESQGFSAEFTATVRQGRQDGLNIVNDNLVADFALHGGNRTDVSFVTFPSFIEVTKYLPQGSDVSVFPPSYGVNPGNAGNDVIVLRYADVLLMHAEAIMAGGAQTSDGAAIDSYMQVRVRAGFDPSADRPSSLSKEALLVERRVELAFENQRFYDLLRFGVADAILGAHAADNGYTDYDTRKLLLPIPAREINLSRGLLTQNAGY
ncbi:MAG: RagB/SusD family nutrient uptake outer membrane protein [Bacteroidota bacterium]